jgi:hypothetical protein
VWATFVDTREDSFVQQEINDEKLNLTPFSWLETISRFSEMGLDDLLLDGADGEGYVEQGRGLEEMGDC